MTSLPRNSNRATARDCTTRSNTEKHPKKESYHHVSEKPSKEIIDAIPEDEKEKLRWPGVRLSGCERAFFREDILVHRRRPDGRAFDKIRQITCEVGLLPRVHGSALFTRRRNAGFGDATLGTKEDMQRMDLLFEARKLQALHAALQLPAILALAR